jgi:hypothetical protein
MNTVRTLVFFFAAALTNLAVADCTDVIALSKIRTEIIEGSSSLETAARNFCIEYSSAKNSGSSMSAGANYKFLSASFGSSNASAEQIASRYCDANDSSKARADSYRQYVEAIAPGAYSAYERCVDLGKEGISINVDRMSISPKYFVANTSFKTPSAVGGQELMFNASPGVKCKWSGAGTSNKVTLEPNTASSLSCERKLDTEISIINIFATTRPNSNLSFQWDAYQNGLQVGLLQKLMTRVDESVIALNAMASSIQFGVVAFALSNCPTGWEEYKEAYGRFVRGIDKSGARIDPLGQRPPGEMRDDEFRSHTHTRPKDVYNAGYTATGSVAAGTFYSYSYTGAEGEPSEGPPSTGASGGSETSPKNVALLYCKRK